MSRSTRTGFTLIELLVIIAIIGILIALLLPAVRRVRDADAQTACAYNLKQLMLALHAYHSDHKEFPRGCVGPGPVPEERLSWMVEILPYVEQSRLKEKFDLEQGYEKNLTVAQTWIHPFLCPTTTTTTEGITSYVATAGIGHDAASRPAGPVGNGFMGYDRQTTCAMIVDGGSSTIALMETRSNLGPWARGGTSTLRGFDPADGLPNRNQKLYESHGNGINVAMADGSVLFLHFPLDLNQLSAAITIAGGESVDLD